MKWTIGDERNLFEAGASDYSTPVHGLYEYIKNLQDEKASEIVVEVDSKEKRIYVYGNGPGLTPERLKEITMNVGRSSKGIHNHGLGMLGFLRFGSSMRIISRCGDKYSTVSCIPKDNCLQGDAEPHYLSTSELKEYGSIIGKLRRLKGNSGTLTMIDGVGRSKSPRFNFSFKFSKEFSQAKITRDLKKLIHDSMMVPGRNYFIFYDGHREKLRPSKKGQTIIMMIPSKEHTFVNAKGQKRYAFRENAHDYELHARVWLNLYSRDSNTIQISFEEQDPLDAKSVIGKEYVGIRTSSIFRGNEFSHYVDGRVNFFIKAVGGAPDLNPYSGSRSHLVPGEGLQKAMVQVLNYIEDYVMPHIKTYVQNIRSNTDEIASKRLQTWMDGFFQERPDLKELILGDKAVDMPAGSGAKCPACGLVKPPRYGEDTSDPSKLQPDCIYATDDQHYLCTSCSRRWPRRVYTAPESRRPVSERKDKDNPSKPTGYSPIGDVVNKALRKRRTIQHTYKIAPLGEGDTRRFMVIGSVVTINAKHPDYSKLALRRVDKDKLEYYTRRMAYRGLLSTMVDDFDTYRRVSEEGDAFFAQHVSVSGTTSRRRSRKKVVEESKPKKSVNEQSLRNQINHTARLAAKWGGKIKAL